MNDSDLAALGLGPRAFNALWRANVRSQQQLQEYVRRHGTLLLIGNIGLSTEREILAALPIGLPAIESELRLALRAAQLRGVYVRVHPEDHRALLADDAADRMGVVGVGIYVMGGDIEVPQVIVHRDLAGDRSFLGERERDEPVIPWDAPAATVIAAAQAAVLLLVRYRLGQEL